MSGPEITPAATRRLRTLRGDFLDLMPDEALEFVRAVRKRRNSPTRPVKLQEPKAAKAKGKTVKSTVNVMENSHESEE